MEEVPILEENLSYMSEKKEKAALGIEDFRRIPLSRGLDRTDRKEVV